MPSFPIEVSKEVENTFSLRQIRTSSYSTENFAYDETREPYVHSPFDFDELAQAFSFRPVVRLQEPDFFTSVFLEYLPGSHPSYSLDFLEIRLDFLNAHLACLLEFKNYAVGWDARVAELALTLGLDWNTPSALTTLINAFTGEMIRLEELKVELEDAIDVKVADPNASVFGYYHTEGDSNYFNLPDPDAYIKRTSIKAHALAYTESIELAHFITHDLFGSVQPKPFYYDVTGGSLWTLYDVNTIDSFLRDPTLILEDPVIEAMSAENFAIKTLVGPGLRSPRPGGSFVTTDMSYTEWVSGSWAPHTERSNKELNTSFFMLPPYFTVTTIDTPMIPLGNYSIPNFQFQYESGHNINDIYNLFVFSTPATPKMTQLQRVHPTVQTKGMFRFTAYGKFYANGNTWLHTFNGSQSLESIYCSPSFPPTPRLTLGSRA